MIFPDASLRIVVASRPVDFRRGHDALAATASGELGLDIYSGVVVIFRSKRGDRLKALAWDGTGLVLTYKRLEQGRFAWPRIEDGVMRLSKAQFEALFEGLDWRRVRARDVLDLTGFPYVEEAEPIDPQPLTRMNDRRGRWLLDDQRPRSLES